MRLVAAAIETGNGAPFWLHAIWHPLHGAGYQLWSGIGSDLGEVTLLAGFIAVYRKLNCHEPGCWRIGKHPVLGSPYITCRKHHPVVPDKLTSQHIIAAHTGHRQLETQRHEELREALHDLGVRHDHLASALLHGGQAESEGEPPAAS